MKVIECPRDAMQGLSSFIPTDIKVAYIQSLLDVGFDTIDAGSFVSPKAIPQMRDTTAVLDRLDRSHSATSILTIVANLRGSQEACQHPVVDYLGFPLSLSETFQQRNTNQSITEALRLVDEIQQNCLRSNKVLVTYLSMGFGNPYGDPYNPEQVVGMVKTLQSMGVSIISLADTIGMATPQEIGNLFSGLRQEFPTLETGVHLHARAATAANKIQAALQAGCRRMDGALLGFGGCPMAEDELVGNIPTELLLSTLAKNNIDYAIRQQALDRSLRLANQVFLTHRI
ncbi:MAG TPA: hydroxymethylglutaryl-CoA lyase [Cyclobacteriaceae bacterium]|nr:hydroxymethylglutaryl-CoA lyase [Cyclobacteriaceae bacterium]